MAEKKVFLSVIIPVYNEAKRLRGVEQVVKYLNKQKYLSELVIVNDGSSDNTLELLKNSQKKLKFKLLSYTPNYGRGYALRVAMMKACGDYRMFLDVDLSTPVTEIDKFIPFFDQYDILVGSRKMKGAEVPIPQPFFRRNMSRVFTLLSKVVLRMNLSDFNCGFKFLTAEAAEKIFPKTTINRWGLDCEILYVGKRQGMKIKEIPVFWKNDKNTTVKFPRDVINSFRELFIIIRNDVQKKYC